MQTNSNKTLMINTTQVEYYGHPNTKSNYDKSIPYRALTPIGSNPSLFMAYKNRSMGIIRAHSSIHSYSEFIKKHTAKETKCYRAKNIN